MKRKRKLKTLKRNETKTAKQSRATILYEILGQRPLASLIDEYSRSGLCILTDKKLLLIDEMTGYKQEITDSEKDIYLKKYLNLNKQVDAKIFFPYYFFGWHPRYPERWKDEDSIFHTQKNLMIYMQKIVVQLSCFDKDIMFLNKKNQLWVLQFNLSSMAFQIFNNNAEKIYSCSYSCEDKYIRINDYTRLGVPDFSVAYHYLNKIYFIFHQEGWQSLCFFKIDPALLSQENQENQENQLPHKLIKNNKKKKKKTKKFKEFQISQEYFFLGKKWDTVNRDCDFALDVSFQASSRKFFWLDSKLVVLARNSFIKRTESDSLFREISADIKLFWFLLDHQTNKLTKITCKNKSFQNIDQIEFTF